MTSAPLPYRRLVQGDAGGLYRCFRLRGGLLLHSMGSFCLLAFGAFPFQRYKATHRQELRRLYRVPLWFFFQSTGPMPMENSLT